ncbi:MAG: hypothetical protein HY295_05620 [Thaumarchaeota archaeon]|nr:hypothetical protein [Nitrososphaerota archaeon]
MPQIRICPNCKKMLQVNEIHKCSRENMRSASVICSKCGQRYKADQIHICPTMIK